MNNSDRMWVAELWRYPVKSMAGERLMRAELWADGIVGDRVVHVRGPDGRVVTSRTKPKLLGHRGSLGPDGEPLVNGSPWDSPEVGREIEAAAGKGARLVRYDGVERFDVLPLLLATDGAIVAFGYDGRRLRPNIVVGGVPELAERNWEGRFLRAGETIIGIQDLRSRCVMTTFDPDSLQQNVAVLKRIVREFGGRLALNCYVVKQGMLRVGDPVELLETLPEDVAAVLGGHSQQQFPNRLASVNQTDRRAQLGTRTLRRALRPS